MDADAVLEAELRARRTTVGQLTEEEIADLALRYAVWLPLETYQLAPWLAPFAVRRIRIRTDDRVPGPKRDLWGMPDEHGYFTDDNSLLKAVIKGRYVGSGVGVYGSRPLTKGLVCCHVWPGTTTDPYLFSFVPNLVWMPKTLARFSDVLPGQPAHPVHLRLTAVALARFRGQRTVVAAERVENAWAAMPLMQPIGAQLSSVPNEFIVNDAVVRLVTNRLLRLTALLGAALDPQAVPARRFSKRYHAGVGRGIDPTVPAVQELVDLDRLQALREEMVGCIPTPPSVPHGGVFGGSGLVLRS
jgi:hypothetical protein